MLDGAGLFHHDILKAIAILAAWAIGTFYLALRIFRWTLKPLPATAVGTPDAPGPRADPSTDPFAASSPPTAERRLR